MSNFPVTNTPSASPAKCGLCGYADKDRQYLDFAGKLDFEWYGSLQICEMCVGSMAEDFGFLQPAQALSLEKRVTEAEQELITLRAAILQLESLGELVGNLIDSGIIRGRDSDSLAVRSSEPTQGIPDQPTANEGSTDSKPVEQVVSEGPDDVSGLIAGADELLAGL